MFCARIVPNHAPETLVAMLEQPSRAGVFLTRFLPERSMRQRMLFPMFPLTLPAVGGSKPSSSQSPGEGPCLENAQPTKQGEHITNPKGDESSIKSVQSGGKTALAGARTRSPRPVVLLNAPVNSCRMMTPPKRTTFRAFQCQSHRHPNAVAFGF